MPHPHLLKVGRSSFFILFKQSQAFSSPDPTVLHPPFPWPPLMYGPSRDPVAILTFPASHGSFFGLPPDLLFVLPFLILTEFLLPREMFLRFGKRIFLAHSTETSFFLLLFRSLSSPGVIAKPVNQDSAHFSTFGELVTLWLFCSVI